MAAKLLFKVQDEELFWQYWQKVLDMTGAGPRYSSISLRHWHLIAKDQGLLFADLSFIYLKDGQAAAAVYLPILKMGGLLAASIPGDYLYAPLFVEPSVEKDVFIEIDRLAQEHELAKIELQIDPLDQNTAFNYLQKYGYLENSLLSFAIDLTVDDFLAACRKGHRYEIKKILDDPAVVTFHMDSANADYAVHEQFRKLHHKMAGKVTRPKATFDLQFERLKSGESALFGLKYNGHLAAFTYFDFRGGKANYASSVHDPDLPPLAYGHTLVYKACEYLKKRGVKFVDTEQPVSPSLQFGYYPDAKQKNIALFKRGFAGRFVQNFRGVKYFSPTAFQNDIDNFIKQFLIPSPETV